MKYAAKQHAAAAALGLLLAAPAWPQSPGAACDALPDDAAKLRCFGEIVRELEARLARDDEPVSAPQDRGAATAPEAPAPRADSPATAAQPAGEQASRATPKPAAAADEQTAEGIEIVEIRQGPLGGLTIRLANGEVWRQIDSDNTRVVLPDENETRYAVIEEGFLGSRRLKILGTARSIRVRRVD